MRRKSDGVKIGLAPFDMVSMFMWLALAVMACAYAWSMFRSHKGIIILSEVAEFSLPGGVRIHSPCVRDGRGVVQIHLRNRCGFYVGSVRVKHGDKVLVNYALKDLKESENLSRLAIHRRLRWSSSLITVGFDCHGRLGQEIEIEVDLQLNITDDELKKWHRFELPERVRIIVREF